MAYNSGLITAPVSVYDCQQCVPVTLSRTVNGQTQTVIADSVGALCGAAVGDTIPARDGLGNWTVISRININKWAKYKPVRTPTIDTVTGQWSAALNTWLSNAIWWKGDGMCGLSTTVAEEFGDRTNPNSFVYKLTHGQLGWSYLRPTGGAQQPFRLQDFASYNHQAQQPYGDIGSTTIYLDQYGAGQIDWDLLDFQDDTNLQLADFAVPNPRGGAALQLTNFYLGLILYNSSNQFIFTSSTKFSTGAALSVAISNMSSYAGTWNCMPFFTKNQVNGQGGFDSGGLFISLADITPISVTLLNHGSNYFDYINGEWNSNGTAIYYDLQIANETSTAHLYSTIRISIYKDSLNSNPVAWTDITNTTVNASSTKNLTGPISVTKQAGSVYWIVVADLTTGTTIPSINYQVEEYGGM